MECYQLFGMLPAGEICCYLPREGYLNSVREFKHNSSLLLFFYIFSKSR
jgi:hypothetical protein